MDRIITKEVHLIWTFLSAEHCMSCQVGPGIEPGPSALKASALPIELTWQTIHLILDFKYILLLQFVF